MRKLFALAAILLTLGMATTVWADCPQVMSATTTFSCTTSVYNDSGSALTSGTVVVWDNDDTEYDRSGYPYVTTTTTADFPHTAGVLVDDSCAAGALCEMVYYGWAFTRIAHSTSAVTEDDLVGTTTVAGEAGAYTGGTADNCALGHVLELYNLSISATAASADNTPMPVFVNIQCDTAN
jgi:hypothetical protein